MAIAMIGRPSWPYRPTRGHDPQGRVLPDRAQPDQGPAQETVGEMASLLRTTRSSMILGGSALSAITVAIGLEAAVSGQAVRPGAVRAARLAGRRAQIADTWTYIAAAYFGVGIVVILLGLMRGAEKDRVTSGFVNGPSRAHC